VYVLWAGERSVESRVRENLTHGSGGGVRKHVAHCDGAPHAYLTTLGTVQTSRMTRERQRDGAREREKRDTDGRQASDKTE